MAIDNNTGIDHDVAGISVTVSRKDVKQEGRWQKFLAMLANTILSVRLSFNEDIYTGQINVSSTVVNILSPNGKRLSVTLRITGSNCYIGSYGVSTTTGFLLQSTDQPIKLVNMWGAIYAVSSGTSVVHFIEE